MGRRCCSTTESFGCINEFHGSISDPTFKQHENDEDGAKPEETPPPIFRGRSLVPRSCYTPLRRRLIHSDHARRPLRDGAMLSPTIDRGGFRAEKPLPGFFA